MNESSGQKTEQPTPKKLRDAREEGQIAQSRELTSLSAMATIIICIFFASKYIVIDMNQIYTTLFDLTQLNNFTFNVMIHTVWKTLSLMVQMIMIPIGLAAMVSLLFNIVQIGGLVITKNFFKFDIEKLNPITNFQSIFSKKSFFKFIKNLVEILVLFIIAFLIIKKSLYELLLYYNFDLVDAIGFSFLLIIKLYAVLFLAYLVFAVIDFINEKRSLHKQLMMTHAEIKQEFKNTEGHPEIKQQRRELHRELVEDDNMSDTIANSTLVLSNPTHIAIVILYKPKKWKLPVVVIKAKNYNAKKVFRYAEKFNIPIIKDIWLARSLYSLAKVGQYVPLSLVSHVGDIFNKNLTLFPALESEIKEILSEMPMNQVLQKTA